jgi:hypothetical protein
MNKLLGFRSKGHALHTKLLRLDTPFVVMPRVTTGSLRNRRTEFWGPNSSKPVIRSAWWFWGPNHHVVSIAPRKRPPTSWTRVPPVLDRASNVARSATSSREFVSQVSETTAGHPSAPVRQPRHNTRLSLLPVSTSPHDLHLSRRPCDPHLHTTSRPTRLHIHNLTLWSAHRLT